MVNTIEAIQNAPNKTKTRVDNKDILDLKLKLKTDLKRELKEELTTDFKVELANQREDIIVTANTCAKNLNSNLQEVVRKQMEEFSKLVTMTLTGDEDTPEPLALPAPSTNPPNM